MIDGRHRYAACAEAGVARRVEYLDDEADPLRYILAKNDLRRHLDESRRAVVAHKLSASSAPGRPRKANGANLHSSFTQGEAAALLRVSRRTVVHAARVLSEDSPAAPEVRLAVERLSALRKGTQWFIPYDVLVVFANNYDPKTGKIRQML